MTTFKSIGPSFKKKKVFSTNITLIAKNKFYKYSRLSQDILYQIGIIIEDNNDIIFSKHKYIELLKYFRKSNNLLLLSGYIISWFQKFDPNEISLVHFLCKCLFTLKVSIFNKNFFIILHEFSSSFKSHDLK